MWDHFHKAVKQELAWTPVDFTADFHPPYFSKGPRV
jgi:hypothetical protein